MEAAAVGSEEEQEDDTNYDELDLKEAMRIVAEE